MKVPCRSSAGLNLRYFIIPLMLVAVLGAAVYANIINGEFLWDDEYLVKENVFIKDPAFLPKLFTTHIAAGSGKIATSYRPLQTLSYMLDYSIWKLDARGYHITNILMHIVAAWLLFLFIYILYNNKLLSFLASALFVVHPIQTEAVSYISGRADPIALLFMLLSFILYIRYAASEKKGLCLLSVLSFAAALFSKESSLVLPLLILAYHYSFKTPVKLKGFLSLSSVAVLYIIFRLAVLKSAIPFIKPPTTVLERIPGSFIALTDYLRLLFLPFGLHMEYGDKIFNITEPKAIASMLIILILVLYLVRKKAASGLSSFSILWFFITLFPCANIYPINAYMAEHWLYIPSVGFFLIIANMLCALYNKRNLRMLGILVIIGLLGFYSFLTIAHNRYWKDPVFFYERTSKFAVNNLRVYNNLGAIYYSKGRNKEAIEMYKKALDINPRHIEAYNNLGVLYSDIGEEEKAVALFDKAIRINPKYAQAYSNLGNVYIKSGKTEEAIASYKKALGINPNFAAAHSNIAMAYFNIQDYDKVIYHCDMALKLKGRVSEQFIRLLKPYRKGTIK